MKNDLTIIWQNRAIIEQRHANSCNQVLEKEYLKVCLVSETITSTCGILTFNHAWKILLFLILLFQYSPPSCGGESTLWATSSPGNLYHQFKRNPDQTSRDVVVLQPMVRAVLEAGRASLLEKPMEFKC